MKKRTRKLNLTRETLSQLDTNARVAGGIGPTYLDPCCQESYQVCSIQHTCWSCNLNSDTCA